MQVDECTFKARKKQWVQFATLQLLIRGRIVTYYKQMYVLSQNLTLKNNPHRHWSDNRGWEMEQCIEHVVLHRTKEIIQIATFFNLSSDEVDCQS